MKSYWVKIILGALAIFGVGMIIRTAIGKARDQVRVYSETSEPVNFPIPFGLLPFKLDGSRLGTVEHLTFLRDAPNHISNVEIMVKLGDSASAEQLSRCLLVVDNIKNVNNNTTFRCQQGDTAGMGLMHYGQVQVEGTGHAFPLLLSAEAVNDLRSEQGTDEIEAMADSISEAAEAMADSLTHLADSVTEVNMERADSIREAARGTADSIREAAMRMADSIRQRKTMVEPPTPPSRRRP
jgi:hypothetical protein